jgi:hypothetical protein
MGEVKGPAAPPELREVVILVAERSLERSEGGKTMSRRALGDVVKGCPPESRVSSSNCAYRYEGGAKTATEFTDLVHNVEIIFEGCGWDISKVFIKYIDERPQKSKCE